MSKMNSRVNDSIRKKCIKIITDGLERIMDLETVEKWKDFPHLVFKDMHEVSNKGRVRNKLTGHIRRRSMLRKYYGHAFHKDGKHYTYTVHSLVAKLFVKNSDPVKNIQVNHIDGNKLNNIYKNLEWVTRRENGQHAVDNGLVKINRLSLKQYDLEGKFIKQYESQTAAAKETYIDRRLISAACNGRSKTAGGFKWKSIDKNPNKRMIDLTDYKQIKSYPNYWLNRKGQVYNKFTKRFIKTKNSNGEYVRLYKKEKNKKREEKEVLLHRLVAKYFLPKSKNKKFNGVRHKDSNKKNNHIKNLEWFPMPHMKHILDV